MDVYGRSIYTCYGLETNLELGGAPPCTPCIETGTTLGFYAPDWQSSFEGAMQQNAMTAAEIAS